MGGNVGRWGNHTHGAASSGARGSATSGGASCIAQRVAEGAIDAGVPAEVQRMQNTAGVTSGVQIEEGVTVAESPSSPPTRRWAPRRVAWGRVAWGRGFYDR